MFGIYARNVIAGQGRYIPDKPPATQEKALPNKTTKKAIKDAQKGKTAPIDFKDL